MMLRDLAVADLAYKYVQLTIFPGTIASQYVLGIVLSPKRDTHNKIVDVSLNLYARSAKWLSTKSPMFYTITLLLIQNKSSLRYNWV
jgi:hypothetical protein